MQPISQQPQQGYGYPPPAGYGQPGVPQYGQPVVPQQGYMPQQPVNVQYGKPQLGNLVSFNLYQLTAHIAKYFTFLL